MESIDVFEAKSIGPKKVPNEMPVMIMGILSLVFCGVVGLILSIIALVMHKKDKELYDSDPQSYGASFKNSNIGRICALIGLILSCISFLFLIMYFIFIFTMLGDDFYRHL